MSLLWYTDPRYDDHEAGEGHPERPGRLVAVHAGLMRGGAGDAVTLRIPTEATHDALARVHSPALLATVDDLDRAGGGSVDADTSMGAGSRTAARLAAGAGLDAIAALDAGEADAAFCAVRPPGHHATRDRSMGFCLYNNVAVAAAHLRDRGERVAVVDIDVHHGNGTQDIFESDPDVLFISVHQMPLYPGSGALDEVGSGAGAGRTINVPVPPGTGGAGFRRIVDRVIGPALARFGPDWLLISAGFDGHRDDPLGALVLVADDYAELVATLVTVVPPGRRLLFLEGGYDLGALTRSTAAVSAALVGVEHAESEGAPPETESDIADRAAALHQL